MIASEHNDRAPAKHARRRDPAIAEGGVRAAKRCGRRRACCAGSRAKHAERAHKP